MNKILVSALFAATVFGAQIAWAQSYVPWSYAGAAYSGACVNLASDLSFGSRGSEVSQLQQFLAAQNYPGGGSWMATGYFGSATLRALRDFQQSQGLSMSGVADGMTRAAIAQASCGGSSALPGLGGPGYSSNSYGPAYPYNQYAQYPYSYSYSTSYPSYPNYNNWNMCGTYPYLYPCAGYTSGSAPALTSLSTTSGAPGTSVTIFGSGFDLTNNAIYVGGETLSGIPSNGASLTFTVPSGESGTVSISAGNSRGTSNALTFFVSGAPIGCGSYPWSGCNNYPLNQYPQYQYPQYPCPYPYNYNYGYGYNCPPPSGPVSISFLSPQQGDVGALVEVYGSGFSATGNSVRFGNGIIANLGSNDGRTLSFAVPSSLSGFGYQPIGLGTYNVSVANAYGMTSNTLPFTVTSLDGGGTISIASVSGPTSLAAGQTGMWTITLNVQQGSYPTVSVQWGDANVYANQSAPQTAYAAGAQTMMTFSHAYAAQGDYTITFTASNQSGASNSATATVTVSGSNAGAVALSSLAPASGRVGTQVLLQGSGFTNDNTIHFGIGGMLHAYSGNGATLYYTIPYYVSPCDLIGPGCVAPAQQVTPGSYQISVTNQNGASQSLTFTVY